MVARFKLNPDVSYAEGKIGSAAQSWTTGQEYRRTLFPTSSKRSSVRGWTREELDWDSPWRKGSSRNMAVPFPLPIVLKGEPNFKAGLSTGFSNGGWTNGGSGDDPPLLPKRKALGAIRFNPYFRCDREVRGLDFDRHGKRVSQTLVPSFKK